MMSKRVAMVDIKRLKPNALVSFNVRLVNIFHRQTMDSRHPWSVHSNLNVCAQSQFRTQPNYIPQIA